MMQAVWLIAKSVLIEGIRRKEIYTIVLISTLLIGAVMTVDFFNIEGLTKFYRETALRIMSIATALAVIALAARQLPREFETRTIYPLMARPISRTTFLAGKLLGVMLSAVFCFGLFMLIYLAGTFYLGGSVPWGLFLQFIYLQLLMMLILSTLSFWLSMLLNFDAAVTLGIILYALASVFTNVISYLYEFADPVGQTFIVICNYAIPQLTLFDLSEKAVHAEYWGPLDAATMGGLTLYGAFYAIVFFGLAMLWFRRKEL